MDIASTKVNCGVLDITKGKLNPAVALEYVSDPGFGGVALFVGRVRDLNLGRCVLAVSYDVFEPLALTVFAQAAAAAERESGPRLKVYVAHAKGRLAVGDLAVLVAVATPHRDEAFRGCRSVIEAVKHRAPIWKREHYTDGDSVWSEGCSLCEQAHEL